MKKICIVAYGDPTDSKTWSRTPANIYNYF